MDKFEVGAPTDYIFKKYNPAIVSAKVGLANPGERPSFTQFVDYLLKTDVADYNDHWIPYWLHCRVCRIEYDAIG